MKNIKLCAAVGVAVIFLSVGQCVQASWFSKEKTIAVNPLNDALEKERNVALSHQDYIDGFRAQGREKVEDKLKIMLDLQSLPSELSNIICSKKDLDEAVKKQKAKSNMTMFDFFVEEIEKETDYDKTKNLMKSSECSIEDPFKDLGLFHMKKALEFFGKKKEEGAETVKKVLTEVKGELEELGVKAKNDRNGIIFLFNKAHPGYEGKVQDKVAAKIEKDYVTKDKFIAELGETEKKKNKVILSMLQVAGYDQGNIPNVKPENTMKNLLYNRYKPMAEFTKLQEEFQKQKAEFEKKAARLLVIEAALKTHLLNDDLPENNGKIGDVIKGALEPDPDEDDSEEEEGEGEGEKGE